MCTLGVAHAAWKLLSYLSMHGRHAPACRIVLCYTTQSIRALGNPRCWCRRKPLDYGVKTENYRACYKGKQFGVAPPREGKTVDTYFEKKHNWLSEVSRIPRFSSAWQKLQPPGSVQVQGIHLLTQAPEQYDSQGPVNPCTAAHRYGH
jgi:hypothetical protein